VRVPGEEEEGARHLHREVRGVAERADDAPEPDPVVVDFAGGGSQESEWAEVLVELEGMRRWDGQGIPEEIEEANHPGAWAVADGGGADLRFEEGRGEAVRDGADEAMGQVRK